MPVLIQSEFTQSLLSADRKRLASKFNLTYRYINDVLSINNLDFETYLGQMNSPELEIKDTTQSNTPAFYLDLLLSIGGDGQFHTSLYDKRDNFTFNIRSRVATPHLRPPIAFLFHNSFDTPELAPLMHVLIFFSRHGGLIKQYKVPIARMLHESYQYSLLLQ